MTLIRSGSLVARKSAGFTLIELLVVMVVLGLVVSLAVVTVGSGNLERELQNEVNRLHAVLRMGAEEAIYSNTEIGAVIEDESYSFVVFNEQESKWEQAPQAYLREYTLPEWLIIDFQREGEEKQLKAQKKDEDDAGKSDGKSARSPDLMLLSSGEVTPFVIGMEIEGRSESRTEIRTSEQGEIVLPDQEQDEV